MENRRIIILLIKDISIEIYEKQIKRYARSMVLFERIYPWYAR